MKGCTRGFSPLPVPSLLPVTGQEVFELLRLPWGCVNASPQVREYFRTFSNGVLTVKRLPASGLMGRQVGGWMRSPQGPFQLKNFRILGSGLGILESRPSLNSSTDFWGDTDLAGAATHWGWLCAGKCAEPLRFIISRQFCKVGV